MKIDKATTLNEKLYSMISYTFNFITRGQLVIREFKLTSLFLKTLSYHQKHLRGSLLNADETHMKLSLKLA